MALGESPTLLAEKAKWSPVWKSTLKFSLIVSLLLLTSCSKPNEDHNLSDLKHTQALKEQLWEKELSVLIRRNLHHKWNVIDSDFLYDEKLIRFYETIKKAHIAENGPNAYLSPDELIAHLEDSE